MERLYTERQQWRYINILLILIFIASVFCYIYVNGITHTIFIDLFLFFIIFCIAELGVLCIWYPDEYMKKIAMERGQVYTAKIKDIKLRDRAGIGLVRQSYVYVLPIECEIDGVKRIWELGNYIDNPSEYIPKDFNCKVYVYNGKYYVQDFYRKRERNTENIESDPELTDILLGKYDNTPLNELLKYSIEEIPYLDNNQLFEAVLERDKYWVVRSKTYVIAPVRYFVGLQSFKEMFIEVHMTSKKAYNESDFDMRDRVNQYVQYLEANCVQSDEQTIYEVSEIVRNSILSRDSRIVIEHIYVVIR